VAITTGVVVVANLPAGLASLDVSAERLGAARFDRAHRPMLHRHEPVGRTKRRAMTREDLRECELAPCRIRTRRMRVHCWLVARWIDVCE